MEEFNAAGLATIGVCCFLAWPLLVSLIGRQLAEVTLLAGRKRVRLTAYKPLTKLNVSDCWEVGVDQIYNAMEMDTQNALYSKKDMLERVGRERQPTDKPPKVIRISVVGARRSKGKDEDKAFTIDLRAKHTVTDPTALAFITGPTCIEIV